ncbi:MAG: GAF domain-containing protein [Phycisphaerales bacterium JB052]
MYNHPQEHPREQERLEALRSLQILDTPIEERFDRITRLTSQTLNMPICAITCIDEHRQWFKSIVGLDIEQTDRSLSFCEHTHIHNRVLVIPDARYDERFASNTLVTGYPGMVFYAGAPIFSRANLPVATLCVYDTHPRRMPQSDMATLHDFARQVEQELHTERSNPIEQALISEIGASWRSSMIDPLTRLWNHEGILTLMAESISYHRDRAKSMGIAVLDLQGYEQIVQQLGLDQGEEYLREFVRRAMRLCDSSISIGRLDEGEFAMLLPMHEHRSQFTSLLNTLCILSDEIHPIRNARKGVAFGLHLPPQNRCESGQVCDRLCDGLYEMRKESDDRVRVQTMSDPQNERAA